MTGLKHPVVGAALAAAVLAALFLSQRTGDGFGTLETVERWTLDWRFRLRGPTPTTGQVALVTFDDATAQQAGPLFERRVGWAQVVRSVKAQGARVIGIDAVFDVPERLLSDSLRVRVREWARARGDTGADSAEGVLLRDVATELNGDPVLAEALAQSAPVVLVLFERPEAVEAPQAPSLARGRYAQVTPGPVPPPEVRGMLGSLPEFNAAAKGLGFALVAEDATRTVRRMDLGRSVDGSVYMPFAAAALLAFDGVNRGRAAYLGGDQAVQLGDRRVALDEGAVWLNYRGPSGTFPTYSAVDVVEGRVPAEALTDKLVLLGISRLGYDVVRTPFESMAGVEVQATVIDALLGGDPLRRSPRSGDLAITLGLGLLVTALFASRRLGLVGQVVGTVVLVAAYLLASNLAFGRAQLWLPWVGPVLTALGAAVTGLVLSYATESVQRRRLRKAFAQYLGEDALTELLKQPGALQLGGERKRLTVLFSDILGFTTLAERLNPETLVSFLNTYLSPMTRAVLAQGGLLDKYIGDAVMGVFGAPVPREDHPAAGLACALAMHRELEALNAGPLKALGLEVAIGVGLNTGDMVVGNMGSAERFDYTVTGDAVNLASRLEGLTRTYGVFCLVGEATRAEAPGGYAFRALDLVQVKGKQAPVEVFELLAGPDRVVAAWGALDVWQQGVTAFRAGQLGEARAHFAAFAQANPTDVVARRYLERLEGLPENAPEGFSPVLAFTTK